MNLELTLFSIHIFSKGKTRISCNLHFSLDFLPRIRWKPSFYRNSNYYAICLGSLYFSVRIGEIK
jgi:hypothetical protein